MEKYKGYQEYLKSIRNNGIKPVFREFTTKDKNLYRLYLRLTNISVKKLNLIPNIKTATNILDIGCGTGEALEYMKEFINPNAQYFGVDLDKNHYLPDYINFMKCDIEEQFLPFEDEKFDVVVSNFVIEHLRNPQKLFLESFRVLKKGGYFYCTTDYITTLFCPDYYNFYADPTHIRPWTKRALKSLGLMSGFDIYKAGIIRWWEFLPLLPVFPLLNILTKSNFSFIPYEIVGRTVYIIVRKP